MRDVEKKEVKVEEPQAKRVRVESVGGGDSDGGVEIVEPGPSTKTKAKKAVARPTSKRAGKEKEKAAAVTDIDKKWWREEILNCEARVRIAQAQLDQARLMGE